MRVIDDDGYIFGRFNIIDALVVLLVIAVVVAGVSLVTATNRSETHTQTVTFRTSPQPAYVVEAISVGAVPTSDIARVTSKRVVQHSETEFIVVVDVKLIVTFQDNVPLYRNERLYIGRTLQLDFGTTIVDGTITDMKPIEPGDN